MYSNEQIHMRIPRKNKETIKKYAEKYDMTMSDFIQFCIKIVIDNPKLIEK